MMEAIIIGLLLGLAYLYCTNKVNPICGSDSKSSFHKLDDKNYIINNKFVSLEEDTPLLRLQQQMEDDKIWFAYDQEQLQYHRERLHNIWKYTIDAYQKRTELHNLPNYGMSNRRLALVTDRYDDYLKDCKRFNETLILSKELFALFKFDKWIRMSIPLSFHFNTSGCGIYYIHNEKTARYKKDMDATLAKEFNDKYFA